MFMEKVQNNYKYIFYDPHSEPYVWPRIEISIAKYMKNDMFFLIYLLIDFDSKAYVCLRMEVMKYAI